MEENPIYKFIRENQLTELDEKSFLDKYSDPQEAGKIYSFMKENKLTELEDSAFYSKYLSPQQQAPTTIQEQPVQKKTEVAPVSGTSSERIPTSGIQDFIASINQTVMNIPADIVDTWSIASAFTERQLAKAGVPGADPNIGAKDVGLGIPYSKITDEYRNIITDLAPVSEEFKGTFAGGVSQGLGQAVGMLMTGGGSRATELAKMTKSVGGSLTPIVNAGKDLLKNVGSRQGLIGGSMNASANYNQAINDGASEEDALRYGIENMVVGSIMENLPIQSMFSRISKMEPGAKILDIVKNGLVGAGEEAVTEGFQTTYENMSAQRIYDLNREMLSGVGDAAAVGGTVGFLLNSAMSALVGRKARLPKGEQEIVDKAVEETQAKIDKVEENNKKVEETVTALENTKERTLNNGATDLEFIENPDGSIEYSQDGLTGPDAEAKKLLLEAKYPNVEFQVVDKTNKSDPYAESDFTIVGIPKSNAKYSKAGEKLSKNQTEFLIEGATTLDELEGLTIDNDPDLQSALQNKVVSLTPKSEPEAAPSISNMAGESVTVRVGDQNISGIIEVDEGGKATITQGDQIYEIPQDAQFTEFTRPVEISQEGDFVVNGDSFSEARIVVEDGKPKALLIRPDGTTKAITNPRVVEEIEYQITLAQLDNMPDEEADQILESYEQQRQTETVAEEGTVEGDETEDDRKLREATEEIQLIEDLALMELEDVESQAKLVEFTPPSMKEPKVYLVKKNQDGTYSATLNGRKVARPEIVAELGKAFEKKTGEDISKLQEQTNKLKQEVEQKLFPNAKPISKQPPVEKQGGKRQDTPKVVPQKPADKGADTKVPVETEAEKANREAGIDLFVAREPISVKGEDFMFSQIKENGNENTFVIEDEGGEIGKAQLNEEGGFIENIRINKEHRRKGLATKLYDFIESQKGIKLKPSPVKQSMEAVALWNKRNQPSKSVVSQPSKQDGKTKPKPAPSESTGKKDARGPKKISRKGKTPLDERQLRGKELQASKLTPNTIEESVLQWFVNKGRLSYDGLQKIFGQQKQGFKKSIQGEFNARRSYMRTPEKGGKSIEEIVDEIYNNLPESLVEKADSNPTAIKSAIENAIIENSSIAQMADRMLSGRGVDSKASKQLPPVEERSGFTQDAIRETFTDEEWKSMSSQEKADFFNEYFQYPKGSEYEYTVEMIEASEDVNFEQDQREDDIDFLSVMSNEELVEFEKGYKGVEAEFAPEGVEVKAEKQPSEVRVEFTVFGERKTGVLKDGKIIEKDGTIHNEATAKDIKALDIKAQKQKVKDILNDLSNQIKEDKQGIIVDFEAKAKADIKFFNTLKNLVIEYSRLKGMQFGQFISEIEKLFNSKLSDKNKAYLKELWSAGKEYNKEPKLKPQAHIKKSTESKPSRKLDTLVNAYTELKRSLRERAKASRLGKKAEKDRVSELKATMNEFLTENKAEIDSLGIKLKTQILKKVNAINSEASLLAARNYIEKIVNKHSLRKEYLDAISKRRQANDNLKAGKQGIVERTANIRKLINVDPKIVPPSEITAYNALMDTLGARKTVLSLPEKTKLYKEVDRILQEIENDNGRLEELAEIYENAEKVIIETDGKKKVSYSQTVDKLLEDELISKSDAELMKRRKTEIAETTRVLKEQLTEAEINKLLDDILTKNLDGEAGPLADRLPNPSRKYDPKENDIIRLFRSLKLQDLKDLITIKGDKKDISKVLQLQKVLDNMENDFIPHLAEKLRTKIAANRSARKGFDILQNYHGNPVW